MRNIVLLLMLCICGCETIPQEEANYQIDQQVGDTITAHENLLREHFLGRHTADYDVATLLNDTTAIANQLRSLGRLKDANRFDSYRDVLMYGQYTIDESINDVRRLIDYGVPSYTKTDYESDED